jgi:hypothetical protein
MMYLFVAIFAAVLFITFRGTLRHWHAGGLGWGMECCGFGRVAAEGDAKSEAQASNHSAFDACRADTLRRLEEEQGEFFSWPLPHREGQSGVRSVCGRTP